jgi:hypothetical protein
MSNKLSKSVEDNLNRAGRPKGVGNKSTGMAREAIAKFVDGNAPAMQGWLEKVADGIPIIETIKEGEEVIERQAERNGVVLWLVPPNPEKAFGMLQSVMEYHLPKLARTEHSGDAEQPMKVIHEHKFLD